MKKKASKISTSKSKLIKQKIKQVVNVNINTGKKTSTRVQSKPSARAQPIMSPSFSPSFNPVIQPSTNTSDILTLVNLIRNNRETNVTNPSIPAIAESEPTTKPRGRPPGSKNKPKVYAQPLESGNFEMVAEKENLPAGNQGYNFLTPNTLNYRPFSYNTPKSLDDLIRDPAPIKSETESENEIGIASRPVRKRRKQIEMTEARMMEDEDKYRISPVKTRSRRANQNLFVSPKPV